MATRADLDEYLALVVKAGGRAVGATADVRSRAALTAVLDAAVSELGGLHIAVANAGICTAQSWDAVTPEIWQDTIDTNLTGVWNTLTAAAPHLLAAGGGSMIAIGSAGGIKGLPFFAPYVAAKHGVVGIARSLANELGGRGIRVNTVHPAGVRTDMSGGLDMDDLLAANPRLGPIFMNALPADFVEPSDVSDAVLFLASDESKFVTGLAMTVDCGNSIR
jgi:NAD(P)-dependent dehydrogenase (short-subunit alcohol dehydrogenase family)